VLDGNDAIDAVEGRKVVGMGGRRRTGDGNDDCATGLAGKGAGGGNEFERLGPEAAVVMFGDDEDVSVGHG
jgi:hypothetical protein